MDDLLKKDNSKESKMIHPSIKELLEEYQIFEFFKPSDFKDIKPKNFELEPEEESMINERIISLLSEKIISEKENRIQTELQIEKLGAQNKKHIGVLKSIFHKENA